MRLTLASLCLALAFTTGAAADDKELRSAQILQNLLGCDNDLAKLFKKIATDLVPNPEVYGS